MSILIFLIVVAVIAAGLAFTFQGWFDTGSVLRLVAIGGALFLAFTGYFLFLLIIGGLIAVTGAIVGMFR